MVDDGVGRLPPVVVDPELPVRLGALLLAEAGTFARKELVRALRSAHAFGPRQDPEECQVASRTALSELQGGGDVAVGETDRVSLTERGRETLAALRGAAAPAEEALAGRVRHALLDAVDPAQARLLADRAAALLRLLDRVERHPRTAAEARVIRVAFAVRLATRLGEPAARRARLAGECLDFFATQAARLRWRDPNRDAPRRLGLEHVRWRTVRRGVAAAEVDTALRRGPIVVHLLRIDPRKVQLRAVDATRLPPEERSLDRLCARFGAAEGTSGGFSLGAEDDLTPPQERGDPVGLLVEDGEVVVPPLFARAALLVDETGHVYIRRVGLRGTTVSWGEGGGGPAGEGGRLVLRTVNRARQNAAEILAFTRAFGPATPADAGRTVTIVRRRVVAQGEGVTPIPANGLVLALPSDAVADPLLAALAPDTPVRFALAATPGEGRIVAALAGGPQLVADGAVALDPAAEEFGAGLPPARFSAEAFSPDGLGHGQSLLPRLAWGVLTDHRLVAVAVEGRDVERSLGETLEGLARFLRDIGCTAALNFEGGSPQRISIDGRLGDLSPSAPAGGGEARGASRPLSSAWVVVPRAAPDEAPDDPGA